MKRKKITFIIGSFPSQSETFIVNQIIGAINSGYKVKISVEKLNDFKKTTQKQVLEKYNISNLIHSRELFVPKKFVFRLLYSIYKLFVNLKQIKVFFTIVSSSKKDKLRSWLRYVNFIPLLNSDIFHVHFAEKGLFLADYKEIDYLKKDVKIVTTFHGYDAHFNEKNLSYFQEKYKKIFNYAHAVIVSSDYLKHKVLRLGCNPNIIYNIPIGVDTTFFTTSAKSINNTFKLISIGRLAELKGHIYGLKVIKYLINKGYNVGYTIIGDGDLKQDLLNYINNNNLQKAVTLTGWKSQKEILRFLKESNLFLMTSINDYDNRGEAFGLATIEAQSTGTPVVAFNTGGVKFTILDNNTGFLVDEKNILDMSNRIISLIENNNKYLEFSKNSRQFVLNNFALEIVSRKYTVIYEN